ncbi:MAG: GYDIA family GHMP kinase [Bacteroidota bacterium]
MPKQVFQAQAHGKLLLTGEYFVLDGVPALAVPTKLGQSFQALPAADDAEHDLYWRAYDKEGGLWFSRAYDRSEWTEQPLARPQVKSEDPASRIRQLLAAAEVLKPGCTARIRGLKVTTRLQFDRAWGLGSSSTLVAAFAKWLGVDPYALLAKTFGGSGYDLACAVAKGPILYERQAPTPSVTELNWQPDWLRQTYFVYQNQKQNSREGIKAYRAKAVGEQEKTAIGEITTALLSPTLHLRAAAQLLGEHERIVSATLDLPRVQQRLFPDFPGQLKSLGAWGGDFLWALSEESSEKIVTYFNSKGYQTVIAYHDMVL